MCAFTWTASPSREDQQLDRETPFFLKQMPLTSPEEFVETGQMDFGFRGGDPKEVVS